MGRPPINLGTYGNSRFLSLAETGKTAQEIADVLTGEGFKCSRAWVDGKLREVRGVTSLRVQAARRSPDSVGPFAAVSAEANASEPGVTAPDSDELPESPEDIPAGTSLEQLDRWIARVEREGQAAAAKGDLAGIGAMGRLAVTLAEAKRKATPLPKADPNDSPDMKAAAKRARDELLKYIDRVVTR